MFAASSLLGAALAGVPTAPWTVLQSEQVDVRCAPSDGGWRCRASALLDVPLERVCEVVEDLASYPEVFASVVGVEPLGTDTWRLRIDLPWPLANQELDVAVQLDSSGEGRGYRLVQVGGATGLWREASWSVEPRPKGSRLTYSWIAPRWPLPGPARDDVLRRQGHNTVWAVALAMGAEPRVESPDP
jgi:hypothetical protein